MESLDLTYKLVDLKIKSKAPDQIYFMSQVFQEPMSLRPAGRGEGKRGYSERSDHLLFLKKLRI